MPTDFERELSGLLQSLTPEPPDHLAFPRVSTLPPITGIDAEAAVVELTTAPGSGAGIRRRWSVIAAAAAVVALATGVIALTEVGSSNGPPTRQPVGTGVQTPTTSNAVPPCRNNEIVVSQGSDGLATHGRAGSADVIFRNDGPRECALTIPSASIGPDTTGGMPFPRNSGTVRIPGHGQLILTAHVRITGRCETVAHGLRINVIDGPWTYSAWLRVAGCTLQPVRLTERIVG
jgi:hypothetical protein